MANGSRLPDELWSDLAKPLTVVASGDPHLKTDEYKDPDGFNEKNKGRPVVTPGLSYGQCRLYGWTDFVQRRAFIRQYGLVFLEWTGLVPDDDRES